MNPMDTPAKLRGLMGLCVRARQAVFGEDGCLKNVRGNTCAVLLVDEAASPATQDKYRSACEHAGVPMRMLPAGLLHEATGKPGMAMAVLPGGLAGQIVNLLPETDRDIDLQPMKSANNGGGASVE